MVKYSEIRIFGLSYFKTYLNITLNYCWQMTIHDFFILFFVNPLLGNSFIRRKSSRYYGTGQRNDA